MSEDSFRQRLTRLHDAHRRGRAGDGGPSGVYVAGEEVAGEGVAGEGVAGWAGLGAMRCGEFGADYWRVVEENEASVRHGEWTIEACGAVDYEALRRIDESVSPGVMARDLLYMDTETTGLGRGAMAFMVGLGFWEGERFVVEQLLIEEEEGEEAMLRAFSARMLEKRLLVTFNGRRFDVPLLARRYEKLGLASPFVEKDHLDLLPLARRVVEGRKRYRLASLERDLLGFERVGDVPGREIPRRWEVFAQEKRAEPMRGVLEHNRHDIVSMAALAAKLAGGRSKAGVRVARPKGVAARLERTYRLRGDFAKAPPERRPAGVVEKTPDRGGEAVERRVKALRGACEELIERGMWQAAFAMICEVVALQPEDPWGRSALARYYRQIGEEELARAVEK